ncbi:MAG TPA: PAS domain S-box protein [candidate division Zixibacteria bacterium]|nr:PAS domain S-box protein [candidate division Zixibacteria bacterium]
MFEKLRNDLLIRLTAIFLLGCLIVVVATGLFFYLRTIYNIKRQSKSLVVENIRLREYFAISWIQDRICALEELAFMYKFSRSNNIPTDDILVSFVDRNDEFFEIFIISSYNGTVLFSTEPGNVSKIERDRHYFIYGNNGSYASQIYFSPSLNAPAMTISTPIFDNLGETEYIVAARIQLDKLVTALGMHYVHDAYINSYIINRWNAFVLGESEDCSKANIFSKGVEVALERGEFIGAYEDWRGEVVIGCCKYIPQLGAVLVSEVNYSEALRSLRKDVLLIIVFFICTILFIGYLFYFFLKRTVEPINAISTAAQSAAMGNLSVRVKTQGPEQIALLASSFNKLVSKLAENLHEIATSNEKRRRLIERANDGFITIDKFGNILDVNPIVTKMWKWTQLELSSMLVFDLFDREHAKMLGQHLRKIVYDDTSNLLELIAVKQSGETFPAEISAISLGDGTYLAIVRDISEKKILEKELIQAQKLESVATLAAGIAHDFDNILVGVLGAASLVKSSTDPEDPKYEMLEVIETSSERAAGLVKQLMTFARQEPPHRESVSIVEIVEDVLRVFRTGDVSTISYRTRLASNIPKVFVDPVQIRQILLNLCNNAIDAMPDGGELTVEVSNVEMEEIKLRSRSSLKAGNYIEIAISDTGAGIPEQELDRIFEPFFTTKPPGKGTGLGLSISHGIIQSHGGTIVVDSTVGIGSTFRAYIPAISAEDSQQSEAIANILIVDKNPSIRRLYRSFLENSGYKALSFSSLDTALSEIRRDDEKIDAIIIGASIIEQDVDAIMFKISSELPNVRKIIIGTKDNEVIDNIDLTVDNPYEVNEVLQFLGKSFPR